MKINKQCTIKNQANMALIVTDVTKDNTCTSNILYEAVLTVLTLLSQQLIIAKQTSGTVSLNDYVLDSDHNKVYSTVYNLILAQPENLLPVKYVEEMYLFGAESYPDILVTAADKTKMQLAFHFYQIIVAYPTANLAKQFHQALLKARDQANSLGDMDAIIDDFFKSTTDYQKLDAQTYAALLTYIEMYPVIFAETAKNATYYFYSVPFSHQAERFSGPASTKKGSFSATYQGSVVFNKKSAIPVADPKDHDGNYQIVFTDSQGTKTALSYDHGQLVSSTQQDNPAICLQGSFINKRYLTQKKADNKIIPIFIGTIDGARVLGTDTKQVNPPQPTPDENGFNIFFDPKTFLAWLALISAFIGLIFAFVVITETYIFFRQKIIWKISQKRMQTQNDDTELTTNEFTAARSEYATEAPPSYQRAQLDAKKLNIDTQIPTDEQVGSTIDSVQVDLRFNFITEQLDNVFVVINSMDRQLTLLSKYTVNSKMEEIGSQLVQLQSQCKQQQESLSKLKDLDLAEISPKLNEIQNDLESNRNRISDLRVNLQTIQESIQEDIYGKVKETLQELENQIEESTQIIGSIREANDSVVDETPDEGVEAEDLIKFYEGL